MATRRTNRRPFIYGLWALLALGSPASADYLKDYWDGREAFRNHKYREAVVFFDRAIRERPDSGGRVRWTGTHFETYLPHYQLGRALDELGIYDRAVDVWDESVRQGTILSKGNRREYRELQRRLRRIEDQRFPAEIERLEVEVDRWSVRLGEIRRRGIGGLVREDGDLETAAGLLDAAKREVAGARQRREIASIGRADASVREAKHSLLRTLERIERAERRQREEAERRRVEEARASLAAAAASLADGGCDGARTETLERLVAGGGIPGDQATLLAALSRAHELCEDALRAQAYLELALADGPEEPELLARRDRLAAARGHGSGLDAWNPAERARAAAASRSVRRRLDRVGPLAFYEQSLALVVGVSGYQAEEWGELPEVRDDVAEVGDLLESHGFTVERLLDPTSDQLRKRLEAFFGAKRRPDTRLVFYYGGHGHTEINDYLRLGYIVPVDTPFPANDPEGDYLRYLVSMDGFEGFARETGANHAMFLFDSCFSGTIFDTAEARFRMNPARARGTDARLERPARLFVTAGDETEMVPAESAFRAAVVRALEGSADRDDDGLVLGAEVGGFVARYGATDRNTPQWGLLDVSPYDEGDLAFSNLGAGKTAEADRLRVELALWSLVASSNDRGEWERYLDDYPEGLFAGFARRRLGL